MRRGAWIGRSRPRIRRAGRSPAARWRAWEGGVPAAGAPAAPGEGGGRAVGGAERWEGRGAAHLSAEGVASGALPPPPLSGRRDSALSAPLRPRSAPAPLRPSLAPSLQPGTAPELWPASLPLLGRARPGRSGSPGQPSSPPRALSHLKLLGGKELSGPAAPDSRPGPLSAGHVPSGSSRLGAPCPVSECRRPRRGAQARASRMGIAGSCAHRWQRRGCPGAGSGTWVGRRGRRGWGSPLSSSSPPPRGRSSRGALRRCVLRTWRLGRAGTPRARRSLSRGRPGDLTPRPPNPRPPRVLPCRASVGQRARPAPSPSHSRSPGRRRRRRESGVAA